MRYNSTQDIFIFIRQFMLADKVSMKELATRLNKSQGAVSGLFRQDNVSLETLNEICSVLGYDLHIDIVKND